MPLQLRSLQVARAGRFGTKGLAITFVSDENDAKILNEVQDRFEVDIGELPDSIDITSYSEYTKVCGRPGGGKGRLAASTPLLCAAKFEQKRFC